MRTGILHIVAITLLCSFSSHAQIKEKLSTALGIGRPQSKEAPGESIPAQAPDALYIGRYPGKVVPKRFIPVVPQTAGKVQVHHRHEGKVEKDTLIISINAEELKKEEQEMQFRKEKALLEAESEILQLQRQKEEMEYISALPAKHRMYVTQHLKAEVDKRALELIERKIELARKAARQEAERLQERFEQRREAHEIRMPFPGRIQYHLAIPDEGESVLVNNSAPVVTLVDDSEIYLAVNMSNPAMSRLDASSLSVTLDMGANGMIHAPWSHSRVEKGDQGEILVYYFSVPEQRKEEVIRLTGSKLVLRLHHRNHDDFVLYSKANLAMATVDKPFSSWEALVAEIMPGFSIVYIGETHICVRLPAKQ